MPLSEMGHVNTSCRLQSCQLVMFILDASISIDWVDSRIRADMFKVALLIITGYHGTGKAIQGLTLIATIITRRDQ
jgi:hypothetical protein